MVRQMLVPLRGNDRIEPLLPYIEQIVHTGMKVVFVVHYGLRGFRELTEQLLAHQAESHGDFLSNRSDQDIPEDRPLSADRKIRLACRRLVNSGAEIDVITYGCKLSAVLENYVGKEDVDLITGCFNDSFPAEKFESRRSTDQFPAWLEIQQQNT